MTPAFVLLTSTGFQPGGGGGGVPPPAPTSFPASPRLRSSVTTCAPRGPAHPISVTMSIIGINVIWICYYLKMPFQI